MSGFKLPVGVLVAWVGLGLFGHDPWKPDEAYTFGLVYHIVQTGEWVVPTLGGAPFMEKPPLFFVTAAAFAKLFGWLLPLHDAARLASAFYVGLALLFTALTARSLYGPGKGAPAALLLAACLGFVPHAHQLITDNSLVAGIAIGIFGLTQVIKTPGLGGTLLGTGAGIAFLSKGLLGPGLLGLASLALLAFPAWRNGSFLKSWLWAGLAFAPWALVWPWLLHRQSPALFHEWLWVQNLGRFSGEHKIGGVPDHWHYLKALPWFALPAWPIAAWTVFLQRKSILSRAELQLPLVTFLVMLGVLSAASLARQIYALPMLLPLCVLAVAGLDTLPSWLRTPLDKLAVWGAAVAALALWALWAALLTGWPAGLALRLGSAAPGFAARVEPVFLLLAVAVTTGWAFVVPRGNLALRSAAATTLVWGLAMTLWLPYLDYAKSYRSVIADMQRNRPAAAGCVASRDLSEPQRAVFHYFAGILSVREGSPAARDCPLLLVHTSSEQTPPHDVDWTLVWRGTRPGDDKERFWLFTSSAPPPGRP